MKKLLAVLTILLTLLSCTNTKEVTKSYEDSVYISPENVNFASYSGEVLTFYVTNLSDDTLELVPDITLMTTYQGKDYLVQRKNDILFKPTMSFAFSLSSNGRTEDNSSLGLIIESNKENLIYYPKDFVIAPRSSKIITLSIKTNNLYFLFNNERIILNSNGFLFGTLNFYNKDIIIKSIDFKLNSL